MKSLKKISLVILAVVALSSCNDAFDDFQVKDGINDAKANKDLNIKEQDDSQESGSLNVIIK